MVGDPASHPAARDARRIYKLRDRSGVHPEVEMYLDLPNSSSIANVRST